MKVPIPLYPKIFELLQLDALNNSQVFLFVAIDCDAVCACHIIKDIFDCLRIQSITVPISGLQDLLESYERAVKDNPYVKSFFLINCGATVNLFEFFKLDTLAVKVKIYVLDSHRPYHPMNIENLEQIFLFDDNIHDDEFDSHNVEPTTNEPLYEQNEEDAWYSSDVDLELHSQQSNPEQSDSPISAKHSQMHFVATDVPSHHGFTSSGLAYILCHYLKLSNKQSVWYAILGLTDQFIHRRIDRNRYTAEVEVFRQVVIMDYPQSDESNQEDDWEQNDSNKILFVPDDFVFMLYRHWNLYDSLFHTTQVALHLEIWKKSGISKLNYWLAKMGLPLQSLISYEKQMSNSDKVCDFRFASFSKNVKNKQVSAADTIHSMSAILESATVDSSDKNTFNNIIKKNFWRAYFSISKHGGDILDEGIRSAITIRKEIVNQSIHIIQKNMVGKSGFYRYCFLKESTDMQHLSYPLALSKLAHFIVDLMIETKRDIDVKPLILSVLLQDDQTMLLLGVEGQHSSSPYIPNSFGTLFAYAARKTNIEITYNSFDTSMVQINKLDFERFLQFLNRSFATQTHY